jgi:hypothetical protein
VFLHFPVVFEFLGAIPAKQPGNPYDKRVQQLDNSMEDHKIRQKNSETETTRLASLMSPRRVDVEISGFSDECSPW